MREALEPTGLPQSKCLQKALRLRRVREEAIRDILFVKAIEDADPEGKLLPLIERDRATRVTMPAGNGTLSDGDLSKAITKRTALLMQWILRQHDWAAQVLLFSGWRRWGGSLVIAAALILGITAFALPASTHVVGLELSFAGLILWNLLVYTAMTAGVIRQFMNHSWQSQRLFGLTFQRIERRLSRVTLPRGRLEVDDTVRYFEESWTNCAGPILAQQLRMVFHLGAAVVAAASMAGLFIWVSYTDPAPYLEAETGWVRAWLLWQIQLLQPIAEYLGVEIPAGLPPARGPDSPNLPMIHWITMGALAVFITVIIPRIVFASVALLESWRLQRPTSVPPEICDYARETYGLGSSGEALPYGLLCYDCSPSESFIGWVAAGSNRLFGRVGEVAPGPSFARGEEAEIGSTVAETQGDVAGYAVMMDFVQTASHKHHGKLIATALAQAAKGRRPRRVLLVLDCDALKKSWWIPNWLHRYRVSKALERWRAFAAEAKVRVYFKRRSK